MTKIAGIRFIFIFNPEEFGECFTSDLMSVSPNDERVSISSRNYLVENYVGDGAKLNPPVCGLQIMFQKYFTILCFDTFFLCHFNDLNII